MAANVLSVMSTNSHVRRCLTDLFRALRLFAVSASSFVLLFSSLASAETMKFDVHPSPSGCSDCIIIEAKGAITATTAEEFEDFLRQERRGIPTSRTIILLDSEGGDLAAGLKLGSILRREGIDAEMPGPPWIEGRQTIPVCLSACAYAFLGAAFRNFGRDDYLAFHQFSANSLRASESISAVTGADLLRDQYVAGVLVAYIVEMDVSAKLYELAAATPPDRLRYITTEEAEGLGMLTSKDAVTGWQLEPFGSGLMVRSSQVTGSAITVAYCRDDEPNYFRLRFFRQTTGDQDFMSFDSLDSPFSSDDYKQIRFLIDGVEIGATSVMDYVHPFGVTRDTGVSQGSTLLLEREDLAAVLAASTLTVDASEVVKPEFGVALAQPFFATRPLPGKMAPGLDVVLLRHCK